MKRYMIFAGSDYYPDGGFRDFFGDALTLQEATEILLSVGFTAYRFDWWHIVDTETKEIVDRSQKV